MKTLFINACVRENSRTLRIARRFLENCEDVTEIKVWEVAMQPLDGERLDRRDALLREGRLDDPSFSLARQFANAEEIVVSAPFWDLSFPALLKTYFENVTVCGITFRYDDGKPIGLCKAKKLTYITTSGGPIFADFGYEYCKALAQNFYGVEDVVCYRVENLDVECVDGDEVLKQPLREIR